MSSDYRGPMRQGVTWQPMASYMERFNLLLDKKQRMEVYLSDLIDQHNRLVVEFCASKPNSQGETRAEKALKRNELRRAAVERELTDLKIHIRAVENGYREP